MPVSIALPAQDVEFFRTIRFPAQLISGNDVGDNCELDNTHVREFPGTSGDQLDISPRGGLTGVAPFWAQVGGRPCAQRPTTIGNEGAVLKPLFWGPAFNADEWAPGAFLDPGSVVATFDIHACLGSAAFPGGAVEEESGFPFVNRGVPPAPMPPNAVAGQAGWGILVGDDGGGGAEFRHVAWNGATVLQRVALAVADVTRWSTFRYTLISGGPSRPSGLSLEVNGSNVLAVQGIPFDGVSLPPTPFAVSGTVDSWGYVGPGYSSGPNMSPLNFRFLCRFGRFTAAGLEVQGV